MGKESITDKIIGASVALIVLASVGLLGLTDLFSAPTTSIPLVVLGLVTTLVAIMFSVAIALLFYRYTKGKGE